MSFNLKYNKEFDTYTDEDFILHTTNKLLLNWKNNAFIKITSPELYVKTLIDNNNSLSREKIWYLLILQLLRKFSIYHNLQYMNDISKTTITYITQDKELDALLICENLNTSCFVLTGDCLVSSFPEDEAKNGPLFDKIFALKSDILKDTQKYLNKGNLKKDIMEEVVPKENLQNKFFDYNEFFFQMFIVYFFTSHEKKLMTGIPQTEMDIRATCFESVEQVCELLLTKHQDTVANIYCSTIAKVQLKDGD